MTWPPSFPILFRKRTPGNFGGNSALGTTLAEKIATYSPYLWWKMDEAAGIVADNAGSDGATLDGNITIGAGTLNQSGPTVDTKSILFDGLATTVGTSLFAFTDARGREGTLLWWEKHDAAYWTDGVTRRSRIASDASNTITTGKLNNNHLSTQYRGGASNLFNDIASPNTYTDWMVVALTWSLSGNALKLYQVAKGGTLLSSDSDSGMPTYSGNATSQVNAGYAASFLKGYISNFCAFAAPLQQSEIQDIATVT